MSHTFASSAADMFPIASKNDVVTGAEPKKAEDGRFIGTGNRAPILGCRYYKQAADEFFDSISLRVS